MIEILFWISILAVFHSYLLFPFSLLLMMKIKKPKKISTFENENNLPSVSLLMSVFNEEKVIEEKLTSILKSNYPENKLEIIIGSDNSTDSTNRIITNFIKKDKRIQLKNFAIRQGKPNIINQLVNSARGEILLLTDANVIFTETTIIELAKYFKEPKIGLVDANMVNKGLAKDGISIQEKAYISREVTIKNREGKLWGAMMGPFGGCFAIRKKLFSNVPSNFLVDDFYINMKIIEKNYASINNTDAIVYEDVSNELKEEFRRKIRIATGNFQNFAIFTQLIFQKNGIGYCYFSHKILRWFGPFYILFALFSSFYLGLNNNFYLYLFYTQLIVLLLPFIDYLLRILGIHIIILRFITHFYNMNLALLIGFIKFLTGVKSNVWQPTKRNR
ncbi:MAG: glycosyltransferase [Chlorobi bacterium]|nr:glycosyltransferase [Chlorobiota bacterium]